MKDKKIIDEYIENFKAQIYGVIKPEVGMITTVFPCEDEGAILEFRFGTELESKVHYKDSFKRISDALATIKQKAFGGNLESFRFSGTNYIMEFHRIIIIKDNSSSEWTYKQAFNDALKFITGGKK